MARKTVADIPSATRYSFLSFTCVTLFSNDVVNILEIYQTRHVSKGKQGILDYTSPMLCTPVTPSRW